MIDNTGDGDHDCHAGEDIEGEVDSMGNQKVRLGCGGYYKCLGHDYWNCPGHFYVCCMGHTDITVNVKNIRDGVYYCNIGDSVA